MFELLTPKSLDAFAFARECSRDWGHPYIGTEHLLCAFLEEDMMDSLAGLMLQREGVIAKSAKQAILAVTGIKAPITDELVPFTAKSKDVFNRAKDSKDRLGHSKIYTGHLLLAMTEIQDCLAYRILQEAFSIDLQSFVEKNTPSLCQAISEGETELSLHKTAARPLQIARLAELAASDPHWKERLKPIMQTANIDPSEVETYLKRIRGSVN